MSKKKAAKISRPNEITKEQFAEFFTQVASGEPMRKACVACGFTAQRFYRLLVSDEALAERYARAKAQALEAMADEIIAIADDGANDTYTDEEGNERVQQDVIARSRLRIDTRKWIMSKLAPKKYGDKITAEHTGADGGPIVTDFGLSNLDADERAAFREILAGRAGKSAPGAKGA